MPPPGEAAAPKAPQARCSRPRSAPSVRLEMTGSGAGGTGSEATWQREGEEEQLASQAREGPPRSPSGLSPKCSRPGLRSYCCTFPPCQSDAKTQYLYSEC